MIQSENAHRFLEKQQYLKQAQEHVESLQRQGRALHKAVDLGIIKPGANVLSLYLGGRGNDDGMSTDCITADRGLRVTLNRGDYCSSSGRARVPANKSVTAISLQLMVTLGPQ